MKNVFSRRLCVIALSTALTGCYAQVEDSSVSFVHSNVGNCSPEDTPCIPGLPPVAALSDLVPHFTVDIGDLGPLTNSQSKQGPVTFNTSLILNQALISMVNSGSASFDGINELQLLAAPAGTSTCSPGTCVLVAQYTRDAVGVTQLALAGHGANLLDIMGQTHQLEVFLKFTGTPPTVNWNASLDLDLAIKTRANLP